MKTLIEQIIDEAKAKLQEPNKHIDSYRCYWEGRLALAKEIELKLASDCKHVMGSSRAIIESVEHWQCLKCKQWFVEQKPMNAKKMSSQNVNYYNRLSSAVRLAKAVIKVMDIKGKAGCKESSWLGFQNGNGIEIGADIERMIKQAKRFLANLSTYKHIKTKQ